MQQAAYDRSLRRLLPRIRVEGCGHHGSSTACALQPLLFQVRHGTARAAFS